MDFDPIAHDLAAYDADYPATTIPLRVESGGEYLLGAMLLAQGAGPHPSLILLHGFPGIERNFDLAQILRRAGWNVLIFHYRGSWGSGGRFAFSHVLEDSATMLAFLRGERARAECRVDPERLALVGHSMGGWAALMTAAADSGVLGAASIAGWNLGLDTARLADPTSVEFRAWIDDTTRYLQGTSGPELINEAAAHADDWNLLHQAAALANRPVLLAAGSRDTDVALDDHHKPLVRALQAAGSTRVTELVLDSQHDFANRRIALARSLVSWLASLS